MAAESEPLPSKVDRDPRTRAEERALVEAAIAQGKVRVIPRGVSGLPDPTKPNPKALSVGRTGAARRWRKRKTA